MTLEHAAEETDKEDLQNQEILSGNTEILKRIVAVEEQILKLEQSILNAVEKRAG